MFLKKLALTKKQLDAIAISTGIFIILLILLISMMFTGENETGTDIDFFGYQFSVSKTEVYITIPGDGQTIIPINDDTYHGLETLSKIINDANDKWLSALRNALIFLYLMVFILIIIKKRDTYLQGLFKGFLIGSALLLLLYVMQGLLEVNSLLISFGHDYTHLFYH